MVGGPGRGGIRELVTRTAASLTVRKIPYMILDRSEDLFSGAVREGGLEVLTGAAQVWLADLRRSLEDIGLVTEGQGDDEAVRQKGELAARHGETGVRVRFLFSPSAWTMEALSRARRVDTGDWQAAFASQEDLLIHRILSGRPGDLEEARTIVRDEAALEIPYIRRWLKEFDRTSEEGGFLERFDEMRKETGGK